MGTEWTSSVLGKGKRNVVVHAGGLLSVSIAVGFMLAAPLAADREWTVMIYMNAKNNLEADALDNFHSMAGVGSSDRVAFVAELGRPSKVHATLADGGWSGVYRFYVERGSKPLPTEAVSSLEKLGESQDMGKAETLESFVRWAQREYPAKRYALIIWNHGQGWRLRLANESGNVAKTIAATKSSAASGSPLGGFRAVSSDDDTGSILYNSEVANVIGKSFATTRLDVLGFDACLMAMIETAYAVAPNVDFMVASEELEPGAGWKYSDWMGKIAAKPEATSAQFATTIVEAYKAAYGNEYLTTLSALKLAGLPATARKLSEFSDAVRKAGKTEVAYLSAARAELTSYGASVNPPLRTSVDLLALLRGYERRTQNTQLRAQAKAVRDALTQHIVVNYASARSADPARGGSYGSEGLAIYFPESRGAFDEDGFHKGYVKTNTDRPVAFVKKETWAELLYAALNIK
jgi:hypothetical protein